MEEKVSIMTPCYNGEKYVGKFLRSILNQTYKNIEFIIVNDGSTDKTEEVILSYKNKFENKGYTFTYVKQENKGQAAAINEAIKHITGQYIIWPDSDDILPPDSVEKRVEFLNNNLEFDSVRSDILVFEGYNYNKPLYYVSNKMNNRFNDRIFEDVILEKTYCSTIYMVRTEAFFKALGEEKQIYVSSGGQNWQLVVPITYNGKVGYIDEPLYYYIKRSDSHSRKDNGDLEKEINRLEVLKDILINTINKINMPEKSKYLEMIERRYWLLEYDVYVKYNDKNGINKVKSDMKDKKHRIKLIGMVSTINKIKEKALNQVKKIKNKMYMSKDMEKVLQNKYLFEGE